MLVSSLIKRVTQSFVAERAADDRIDEHEAGEIVDEIRARFPVVADRHQASQTEAMSSLWHRLHGRDYYVEDGGPPIRVRVLPTAEPTPGACEVLNSFAEELPPLPGVEPDFARPLRFGDFERHYFADAPDLVVRRGLDGEARITRGVESPSEQVTTASPPTSQPQISQPSDPGAEFELKPEDIAGLASSIQAHLGGLKTRLFEVDLSQTPLSGARMQLIASRTSTQIYLSSATPEQRRAFRDAESALVERLDSVNVSVSVT